MHKWDTLTPEARFAEYISKYNGYTIMEKEVIRTQNPRFYSASLSVSVYIHVDYYYYLHYFY
jgi:hypothetical protein